jgi:hypothetical protein
MSDPKLLYQYTLSMPDLEVLSWLINILSMVLPVAGGLLVGFAAAVRLAGTLMCNSPISLSPFLAVSCLKLFAALELSPTCVGLSGCPVSLSVWYMPAHIYSACCTSSTSSQPPLATPNCMPTQLCLPSPSCVYAILLFTPPCRALVSIFFLTALFVIILISRSLPSIYNKKEYVFRFRFPNLL